MKNRISVLGSTGSIGVNTLDVIARHRDQFSIFALTGATQVDLLFQQCVSFKPDFAVMVDTAAAKLLEEKLANENIPTRVLSGPEALVKVASDERVDTVMAAIVGAAGLPSCMAYLDALGIENDGELNILVQKLLLPIVFLISY